MQGIVKITVCLCMQPVQRRSLHGRRYRRLMQLPPSLMLVKGARDAFNPSGQHERVDRYGRPNRAWYMEFGDRLLANKP